MLIKLIALLAFVAAASAAEVLLTKNPINLRYRAQAGKDGKPLSAELSLDCNAGNDQYEIIVKAVDTFARAEKSSLGVTKKNGVKDLVLGSGVLSFKGNLTDLILEATEKNCDGSGASQCGAVRRGKVSVRQYIEVPNTESKLHWPGFYDVDFECRLSPVDPLGEQLVNSGHTVPPGVIEQCIETTHK